MYEIEDYVDWSDGELEVSQESVSTHEGDDVKTPKQEDSVTGNVPTTGSQKPDLLKQQAEEAMLWTISHLFEANPGIGSALRLYNTGDSTSTVAHINGTTYEVTWKIIDTYDVDTPAEDSGIEVSGNATPVATPPSEEGGKSIEEDNSNVVAAAEAVTEKTSEDITGGTTDTPEDPITHVAETLFETPIIPTCKFGKYCNKGDECKFDHSVRRKLCTWVNTAQGCSKGENCAFSHEIKGTTCKRSPLRRSCPNGYTCAYKHQDDSPIEKRTDQGSTPATRSIIEKVDSFAVQHLDYGGDLENEFLSSVPTGPANLRKPSLSQGKKRARSDDFTEDFDDYNDPANQKKPRYDSPIKGGWKNGARGRAGNMRRGRGRSRNHT